MKSFFISLFLCLLIASPLNVHAEAFGPSNVQQEHSTIIDSNLSIMALKGVICILLGEVLAISADQESKNLLAQQMQLTNLAKNMASNYGSLFVTTLCHELGHALASRILNGDPVDVHLGANSTDGNQIISFAGISIDGLDPRKGYCNHAIPYENKDEVHNTLHQLIQMENDQTPLRQTPSLGQDNQTPNLQALINELRNSPDFQAFRKKIVKVNPTKQALILLAGGIGGMLGRFLTKTVTHLITHRTNNQAISFKQSLLQACTHACKLDHIYVNQLLNMLVPFNTGSGKSDATKLWEDCAGISPSVIQAVQSIAPMAEVSSEQYLARIQAINPDATDQTKALIGLLNYLNGGFVRLHV